MYRPNVCIVITNKKQNKVLMFHRVGATIGGWQFPQGGVDSGESEKEAMLRELKEEIGTNRVKKLKKSSKQVKYKYPDWVLEQLKNHHKKQKYVGQKQRWYLVRLKDGIESIRFDHDPPEFDDFKWVSIEKVIKKVIPFKRKAYKEGLTLLGLLE